MRNVRELSFAIVLALSLAPRVALADDRATTQALFDEAAKLMEEKAYDKACPKLEEVVRIESTKIGASLELARCYEGAGRLASAWARYKAAAGLARAAGDARADDAEAKAKELAPRIPKLTVVVAAANRGLADLKVTRDKVDVSAAQWDTALPVDPGTHVVTATAAGKKPWQGSVDATTPGATARLEVPALTDEDEGAKPAAVGPVATPERAPSPAASTEGKPAWAWVAGSAGVVAAGVGVGLGVAAAGAQSSWHKLCPGGTCPAGTDRTKVNGFASTAHTDVALAGVLGGVGVAAIGVAVIGLVTSKPKPSDTQRAHLVVSPAGVGVGGAF